MGVVENKGMVEEERCLKEEKILERVIWFRISFIDFIFNFSYVVIINFRVFNVVFILIILGLLYRCSCMLS